MLNSIGKNVSSISRTFKNYASKSVYLGKLQEPCKLSLNPTSARKEAACWQTV